MGLLDDAIREHLELKRRRGADPTEVDRAEREALGPVRRGPEPAGADYEDRPALEEELDYAAGPEQEPYDDEDDYEPPVRRVPREPEPVRGFAEPFDDDEWEDEPLPHGPETAEYDAVKDEPPTQPGDEMLEETPEFLQDTPDHDRL